MEHTVRHVMATFQSISFAIGLRFQVRWSVYVDYMRCIGLGYSAFVLFLFVVGQVLQVTTIFSRMFLHTADAIEFISKIGGKTWLSLWSVENDASGYNTSTLFHLGVLAAFGFGETIVAFTRQVRKCSSTNITLNIRPFDIAVIS